MASRPPRCSMRIWRCLGAMCRNSTVWGPRTRDAGRVQRCSAHPRRRYPRAVGSRRPPTPRKLAGALGACLLLALALAIATAPAAPAAGLEEGAINELRGRVQQETTPTQTTPTTPSTESSSSSNTGTLIVLATGVAIVLLVGIGYLIF